MVQLTMLSMTCCSSTECLQGACLDRWFQIKDRSMDACQGTFATIQNRWQWLPEVHSDWRWKFGPLLPAWNNVGKQRMGPFSSSNPNKILHAGICGKSAAGAIFGISKAHLQSTTHPRGPQSPVPYIATIWDQISYQNIMNCLVLVSRCFMTVLSHCWCQLRQAGTFIVSPSSAILAWLHPL
jgi:hypothetical protein